MRLICDWYLAIVTTGDSTISIEPISEKQALKSFHDSSMKSVRKDVICTCNDQRLYQTTGIGKLMPPDVLALLFRIRFTWCRQCLEYEEELDVSVCLKKHENKHIIHYPGNQVIGQCW